MMTIMMSRRTRKLVNVPVNGDLRFVGEKYVDSFVNILHCLRHVSHHQGEGHFVLEVGTRFSEKPPKKCNNSSSENSVSNHFVDTKLKAKFIG